MSLRVLLLTCRPALRVLINFRGLTSKNGASTTSPFFKVRTTRGLKIKFEKIIPYKITDIYNHRKSIACSSSVVDDRKRRSSSIDCMRSFVLSTSASERLLKEMDTDSLIIKDVIS
jgi:hypothetical protein